MPPSSSLHPAVFTRSNLSEKYGRWFIHPYQSSGYPKQLRELYYLHGLHPDHGMKCIEREAFEAKAFKSMRRVDYARQWALGSP